MKLFILLLFPGLLIAQISGRILSGGYPDIVIKTTVLQTGQTTDFDVDGYFSIKIPEKHSRYEVLIETPALKLKIINLLPNMEINLGDIELPEFKIIDINEYAVMSSTLQNDYLPVYCWANILGYQHKTLLDKNYILFTCNGLKKEMNEFSFDAKTKTITIDAALLPVCD